MKTLRLAALIAVGNNPYNPIITEECFIWAEKFIRHGTEKLSSKFVNGIPSDTPDESQQSRIVIEHVCKYLATDDWTKLKSYGITEIMFRTHAVPYSYLHLRCARNRVFSNDKIGATNAIKRAIQNLTDNGDLHEIPKGQAIERFNFSGKLYVIPQNSKIFEMLKTKIHFVGEEND
jgi:hypothetical protein